MEHKDPLWAKSKRKNEAEHPSMFLLQHLKDVHAAAERVFDATGEDQLSALDLTHAAADLDRFRRCVLLAAALHDLGKANDHFQGMILGKRKDRPQGLRHEWVTVLLLQEPLRDWLLGQVNKADLSVVEWAVGGHHPAYNRESPPRRADPRGAGDKLVVLAAHPDFAGCLIWLSETFGGTLPTFDKPIEYPLIGSGRVDEKFGTWFREALRTWEVMSPKDKVFAAAVKACVLGADVAGSALPREVADIGRWIDEAFFNRPQPGELDGLVERRLVNERKRRNDQTIDLRPFQKAIGGSNALVTLVRAGCGSGKTMAAYHWAAKNHPGRRLYFCYPTTGTATEGFKDYLHNPDAEHNYRLFHGRADVDLAGLLTVKGDEPNAEADAAARLESLDAWGTPIVSCTVDTVLGLVQNSRRGLFAWPALAQSAFVFDEIHAYDDRLFGALLRFLQAIPKVPVLLMTASLPQARLQALKDCLARDDRLARDRSPRTLNQIPEPGQVADESEKFLRYVAEPTPEDVATRVKKEFGKGGKVLWVCNTVKRAMDAAKSVATCEPKVYHSRFRYCDRVKRHNAVVNAFKRPEIMGEPDKPVIACTTQVAEMSLDLKGTTLLLTELAPVPALIQRLGRLNRDAGPDSPPRPFIVIEVGDDHLPYTPDELASAREWLKELGTKPLSQHRLAEAWQDHDKSRRPDFVASAWLDGGPSTPVLELREVSPGITVVLAADAADVKAGRQKLAEVAIPMPPPPRGLNWREWESLRGCIPVAPADSITYDAERGAEWVAPKAKG